MSHNSVTQPMQKKPFLHRNTKGSDSPQKRIVHSNHSANAVKILEIRQHFYRYKQQRAARVKTHRHWPDRGNRTPVRNKEKNPGSQPLHWSHGGVTPISAYDSATVIFFFYLFEPAQARYPPFPANTQPDTTKNHAPWRTINPLPAMLPSTLSLPPLASCTLTRSLAR